MDLNIINNIAYPNFCQYSPNLITVRAYGDNWPLGENSSQAATSSEITQPTQVPNDSQEQQGPETEDTFGLEFAAYQYLNLVTNAEQLFNKLLGSIVLSGDEKEQIERWLCLKQECEDCVASDEATSFGERHRHSLERIEEQTERTDNSSDLSAKLSDSQYESETESDFDSNHPDFEDRLDGYIERFKDLTDELIRQNLAQEETAGPSNEFIDNIPPYNAANIPIYQQGRRRSLHPGSIQIPQSITHVNGGNETEESLQSESPEVFKPCDNEELEPYKEFKMLCSGNDAKRTQIKQVLVDLESAQRRIEELQHTIQIKEQFIREMIKNSETRNSAKLKFQRKWSRLEEEYYKTRTQLAQAETALHETKKVGSHEAMAAHRNEVEKYKNLARYYEKRLKDIDSIKQIAGDSAKKVLELENSLQYSKKQMEKLKKQLKREETNKVRLEQELHEDQQKMKDLQEKYNLQMLDKGRREGSIDGERMKWIAEETERLNVMRESSQRLHQQLVQQQDALSKREAFIKEKVCLEKQRDKNLMEVTARISHLENMLKEKSGSADKPDEEAEKERLRQEIHHLRTTRDHYLDERSCLDEKFHQGRRLSSAEERRYLESAEAIEAIDAVIEYKNELICGRKDLESAVKGELDEGEQLLMARLLKLSPDELRTLLYKYFQKVIDLRESGRRMEEQLAEADQQLEEQSWKVQELNHALQSERIESERKIVGLQRENQEKVHLMLRHFAEESGGSGTEAGRHLMLSRDNEMSKLKRENKSLRRRLQDVDTHLQATSGHVRIRSRSASPDRPMRSLPAPATSSSSSTTKVTREKNKVIIRLAGAPKKKSTKQDLISFHK